MRPFGFCFISWFFYSSSVLSAALFINVFSFKGLQLPLICWPRICAFAFDFSHFAFSFLASCIHIPFLSPAVSLFPCNNYCIKYLDFWVYDYFHFSRIYSIRFSRAYLGLVCLQQGYWVAFCLPLCLFLFLFILFYFSLLEFFFGGLFLFKWCNAFLYFEICKQVRCLHPWLLGEEGFKGFCSGFPSWREGIIRSCR